MSYAQTVRTQLKESADLKLLMQAQAETIGNIAKLLEKSLRSGGKVLLFGNGGSAADAQHIAAELTGKFRLNRAPLPALALTTNSSVLTAIANDYDYTSVFTRQVESLVVPGDVAIGISTSGRSPNVLNALRVAKEKNGYTIGLCGEDKDEMENVTDYCISVPSMDTARIQEIHITIGHIICDLVEQALFATGNK
jgi:D-sedoheptulose 7-phosphate isomerase